jgi:cytidyltransferase-like protein
MSRKPQARSEVVSLPVLRRRLAAHRRAGRRVVFTNGVFDLIHPGHVRYLRAAKRLGDVLVVGINSDRSARRLGKGPGRPLVGERDRAEVLSALEMVDYVTTADDTPLGLIRAGSPTWGERRRLVDRPSSAPMSCCQGRKIKSLRFASVMPQRNSSIVPAANVLIVSNTCARAWPGSD